LHVCAQDEFSQTHPRKKSARQFQDSGINKKDQSINKLKLKRKVKQQMKYAILLSAAVAAAIVLPGSAQTLPGTLENNGLTH